MKCARWKIVSMRVNDEEWEELTRVCSSSGKTVSQFLREALFRMEGYQKKPSAKAPAAATRARAPRRRAVKGKAGASSDALPMM